MEAEKLDPCLKGGKGRQGKQTEALLSSSVTWPGPAVVGLGWELRGWGGPRDRACLSAARPHSPTGTGKPAVGWEQ